MEHWDWWLAVQCWHVIAACTPRLTLCLDDGTPTGSHLFLSLSVLPSYLCTFISVSTGGHNLCSSDLHLTSVPKDQTELGRKAFSYFAPSCWISQQAGLKLEKLITVDEFQKKKKMLKDFGSCLCFWVFPLGYLMVSETVCLNAAVLVSVAKEIINLNEYYLVK